MQVKQNNMVFKQITANYTLDVVKDQVIMANTSSGDITVTLPLKTTFPSDAILHTYYIYKVSSDVNKVYIQLSGSETFPLGYTKIILVQAEEHAHLGGNVVGGWSKITNISTSLSVNRSTIWNASNFSSDTAVPFNNVVVLDNDEIFDWSSSNPTRLICKIPIRANFSYVADLDSTGGYTWTCVSKLRINGSTDVSISSARTGNYGSEDQSVSVGNIPIVLAANDYVEFILNHTNLTGRLRNATVVMQSNI